MLPRPPMNTRSKGQRSRSQGHKVHNVRRGSRVRHVWFRLCSRATRPRRATTQPRRDHLEFSGRDCLIEGDRGGRRQLCALWSAQPLVFSQAFVDQI